MAVIRILLYLVGQVIFFNLGKTPAKAFESL